LRGGSSRLLLPPGPSPTLERPPPCAVVLHACCYHLDPVQLWRGHRLARWFFTFSPTCARINTCVGSNKREAPPGKPVASLWKAFSWVVATSVSTTGQAGGLFLESASWVGSNEREHHRASRWPLSGKRLAGW